MGDKPFDYIENSRLISFIEKTMPWKFDIKYVPGRSVPGPDTTSRRPTDNSEHEDEQVNIHGPPARHEEYKSNT